MRRAAMIVALMSLLPVAASAQSIAWVDQFGTEEYEEVWGTLVVDQTLYVSGWTHGTLPGQPPSDGGDGFLRAYDLDGKELWTVRFGTADSEQAWSLATDGTGLYVTGITNGTFDGQTAAGDSDAFVAKFDLDGEPLWVTQFGTRRSDLGSNVVADATGVYVVGATGGRFPGQDKAGGQDAFHAHLDADGVLLDVIQFGSPESDFGFVNAIGPDGVYVNGYTWGLIGDANRGGIDAFVGLFATDDSMTWLRQFGTIRDDFAYGLVADAAGVYVTGETGGRMKGQTDRGESDAFARLLSATDGSTVWTSQFGTRDIDVSFGAALSGGVLYAIGSTAGGFGNQPGIGKGDGFVRAIDAATGAKVWTHQFGTERNDSAYAGWVDGSAIYVVGWTRGAFPGFERLGSADAFVARIDLPPPG